VDQRWLIFGSGQQRNHFPDALGPLEREVLVVLSAKLSAAVGSVSPREEAEEPPSLSVMQGWIVKGYVYQSWCRLPPLPRLLACALPRGAQIADEREVQAAQLSQVSIGTSVKLGRAKQQTTL
jgi:hypothetical protein